MHRIMMRHGKPLSAMESLVVSAMEHLSPSPRTYGEYLASRPRRKIKGWQKSRK